MGSNWTIQTEHTSIYVSVSRFTIFGWRPVASCPTCVCVCFFFFFFLGGGGGGTHYIFGWGCAASPKNPHPISDQNVWFSIPYFRPKCLIFHTLFQTKMFDFQYPISDQNVWFSIPYFRPKYLIFHTLFQTKMFDFPYPISDQNFWFSIPYFKPKYLIFHTLFQTKMFDFPYPISDLTLKTYTLFQTLWCVAISATLNRIYGGRDFVTAQTMFIFFSRRSMSTATNVTLKMVSQTKQTEYTPYFRPKWQNLYPRNAKK